MPTPRATPFRQTRARPPEGNVRLTTITGRTPPVDDLARLFGTIGVGNGMDVVVDSGEDDLHGAATDVAVLDARTAEMHRTGRCPGSHNLPLAALLAGGGKWKSRDLPLEK